MKTHTTQTEETCPLANNCKAHADKASLCWSHAHKLAAAAHSAANRAESHALEADSHADDAATYATTAKICLLINILASAIFIILTLTIKH